MDYQDFRSRFLEAANRCRDFSQEVVEETLPQDCRFHLHLNQSHDANASPGFTLFPEDSSEELAVRLKHLTVDEVVNALWRDGMVPQWVNVIVVGETGAATLIDVIACGRFTADEAQLYPFELAPFSVQHYREEKRFSIYRDSTCWTEGDLERVGQHSKKVRALTLCGPAFTDQLLSTGLDFPELDFIHFDRTPVSGPGLSALGSLPKLHVFRMTCAPIERLDLTSLPVVQTVEFGWLFDLPRELTGVAQLCAAFPKISDLDLRSSVNVQADGELLISGLKMLGLHFPGPQEWIRRVPGIESLSLTYESASDDDVAHLLQSALSTLTYVGLRGTPVTNEIFSILARIPNLARVSLGRTQVTLEAMEKFAQSRPHLRYSPRRSPRGQII